MTSGWISFGPGVHGVVAGSAAAEPAAGLEAALEAEAEVGGADAAGDGEDEADGDGEGELAPD
ncbi:hypothetical protein [Kitasatospora viridis]|uniref:hypothetical protein n=1 Tax=Kitasatospora viridis TaxID=281105 RepID=UPI001478BC52|nr:hypothetical protein [Kitasatospora viridis]